MSSKVFGIDSESEFPIYPCSSRNAVSTLRFRKRIPRLTRLIPERIPWGIHEESTKNLRQRDPRRSTKKESTEKDPWLQIMKFTNVSMWLIGFELINLWIRPFDHKPANVPNVRNSVEQKERCARIIWIILVEYAVSKWVEPLNLRVYPVAQRNRTIQLTAFSSNVLQIYPREMFRICLESTAFGRRAGWVLEGW